MARIHHGYSKHTGFTYKNWSIRYDMIQCIAYLKYSGIIAPKKQVNDVLVLPTFGYFSLSKFLTIKKKFILSGKNSPLKKYLQHYKWKMAVPLFPAPPTNTATQEIWKMKHSPKITISWKYMPTLLFVTFTKYRNIQAPVR